MRPPCNPFAVVDIGSNTVKLTVHRCDSDGSPTTIHHESDTVRIGHGVSTSGCISEIRATRLLECLRRMESVAVLHGASTYYAVGTQAFRQAQNGDRVRDLIREHTAWRLDIISGDDETRLTLEGARPFLEAGRGTVIADVGGASTEIVVASTDGIMTSGGSVAVGSGSLFDDWIHECPPPPDAFAAAARDAVAQFQRSKLLPAQIDVLLLPGGTGNLLRQLLHLMDPMASLDSTGLALLHNWLISDDGQGTASHLGIQLERAQVLPASLAIVETLVELLCPNAIRAIPSGVGLGIAHMVCTGQWPMPH